MVAAYARVSTGRQENEGTVETQLMAINDFAEKNGLVIVQNYIDNGWSGDYLVRPALDQLRIDAGKKNWQAVLAYDPDRIARRGSWEEVVKEELKDLNIELLYVTVPPPKTDEEVIMYKMRGVFTEYERVKIKERMRLGKLRKAREGHVLTTEAPYGYTFITKRGKPGDADFHHGYYVINEHEAQVVKQIFSWIADDGQAIREVVRKLQELGIAPRRSQRGVWNTSTLSTLLRNKTYIGVGHYGASYAVVPERPMKEMRYKRVRKSSRRARPESEWIKIPTPAIIDEATFNKVAQQLVLNKKYSPRNTKGQYLLSGRLWCTCGKRLSGSASSKFKAKYYRCSNKVLMFPLPKTCEEKGMNATVVDSIIWSTITNFMTSPDLLKQQLQRWSEEQRNAIPLQTVDIEALEKELDKLKAQEARFTHAYGAGLFTVETLAQYVTPIRTQIATVENEISQSKESPKTNEIKEFSDADILNFAEKCRRGLPNLSFEEKKAIIAKTVERIDGSREQLTITGYLPIAESNVELCTNCRDGQYTMQKMRYSLLPDKKGLPFKLMVNLPTKGLSYILARKLTREGK